MTEGDWHTCVVDNDYEINDVYPYPIRKKGSDKIICEWIDKSSGGYILCRLNGKHITKHKIIALQFIDNDDPETKTEIDHIDHNRANNHIDNLRWVSRSDNQRNKSSYKGRKFIFLEELPETAEPLDSYNGHDLDGVFVDYEQEKVYLFNGVNYREVPPNRHHGNIYYRVNDIEDKRIMLSHLILFG